MQCNEISNTFAHVLKKITNFQKELNLAIQPRQHTNFITMAITIRPTPVLSGTNAERFLEKIEKNKSKRVDFSAEVEKSKKILAKSRRLGRQD